MAVIAACTDKGAKRRVNQDACCVQVAATPFGEITMAVVCDGVGGLSAGELASATVAYRFTQWFREELPTLLAGMDSAKPVDLDAIQLVWGVLLSSLNETIQAYGRAHSGLLGTTFSGLLLCDGRYVIGHVGDCRVYQLGSRAVRQVTDDQTLLAKKLASGELTSEEAGSFKQGHVILQSVGTEGVLKPAFYQGTYVQDDLFVICCDGAYRKAENAGIHTFFEGADRTDESALQAACKALLTYDLSQGEKDNLTIVCVAPDLQPADTAQEQGGPTQGANMNLDVEARNFNDRDEDEDLVTMVQDDDDDDLPTMVEPQDDGDDEDLPTMVEVQPDEEDLPTMVESQIDDGEEDIPTLVEAIDEGNEDDLPTMVEGDEE